MSGHSMASGQSGGDMIEMTDIVPVPEGGEEFMTVPAQQIPKTQRLINFIKEAWNGMTSSGSVGSSEEGWFLSLSIFIPDASDHV